MQQIEFTRINNDVNGNPRYCIHFLDLLSHEQRYSNQTVQQKFTLALNKAKTIGGKTYRGKDMGGMIVFQSYSTPTLTKNIVELQNN